MSIQLNTSVTTMRQLQQKLDGIAHNMSNIDTIGFKRRSTTFAEALVSNIHHQHHPGKELGRLTPHGIRVGHGSLVSETRMIDEQGSIRETNRELDLMIDGNRGWFQILHSWIDGDGVEQEQIAFTRDGSFQVGPTGEVDVDGRALIQLQTADGHPVLGIDNEPILFSSEYDTIRVNEDGEIEVQYPEGSEIIGQLHTAVIHQPQQLHNIGSNLFVLDGEYDEWQENGVLQLVSDAPGEWPLTIHQGVLETSNVDLAMEINELLTTQRMMQFQARALSMADEMMGIQNAIR